MLKRFRPEGYTAMAVYLATAVVFFLWDALFVWPPDKYIGGDEIATMFIPWLTFILDTLRQHGQLPLWNPYLFAGVPFAANPQPMMFYPFTYLGLLMPLARALALTLAIHAWLGGMGMYGWLRRLGATHAGAGLAGLAFAFTGAFTLRLGVGHYGIALQLAWWPLSFWAMRIAFDKASLRWTVLSSVPLAMGLLSGHTATCLLLYLALGLYTLFEAGLAYNRQKRWQTGARIMGQAAFAVVVSLALAAVQYLPLLTFARLSVRAASTSLDFSSRFSMPVAHLITLLIPDFFGEVMNTGIWSVEGYEEVTYYVGVLVFLLAVVGARMPQRRHVLFLVGLALMAVLLQLGPDGVLFTFFYRFVPGFALTRAPGRAGLIYLFAIISAAGLVWSELERARRDPPEELQQILGLFNRTMVWVISLLGIGASTLAFVLYAATRPDGPAWSWHVGEQVVRFLVLFWAVMALFAAWRSRHLSQQTVNLLAALIILFDLWGYAVKSIQPGDDLLAQTWPDVANFMQDKRDYRVAAEDMAFFELNGALAYRVRGHYGYDPLVLAHYQRLLGSASSYFDRVYDLLNIRYLAARNPLQFPEGGGKYKRSYDTYALKVYRRPEALPRAFIVHEAHLEADDNQALAALHADDFDIRRTVTLPAAPPCRLEAAPATGVPATAEESAVVTAETPNSLELAVNSASAGLLVLSEVYYPGWQARVDGQPVSVLQADTALRALCLPAGVHQVRLDFRPRDLAAGGLISCLTLGLVIGAAVMELAKRRR